MTKDKDLKTIKALTRELEQHQDPEKAKILQKFFKTGPGEYGEGDIFIGIKVPQLRQIAKPYYALHLDEIQKLLNSPIHEHRFIALVILMAQYKQSRNESQQQQYYQFYVKNFNRINNWDLVDLSAPHITGHYLFDRERDVLLRWASSKHLWTRRIAMLSTFFFIRQNDLSDCLVLAERLLQDKEDLMHKAVGWMLREAAKKDYQLIDDFLLQHYQKMPRTMLRYAIERFPEDERQAYIKGKK